MNRLALLSLSALLLMPAVACRKTNTTADSTLRVHDAKVNQKDLPLWCESGVSDRSLTKLMELFDKSRTRKLNTSDRYYLFYDELQEVSAPSYPEDYGNVINVFRDSLRSWLKPPQGQDVLLDLREKGWHFFEVNQPPKRGNVHLRVYFQPKDFASFQAIFRDLGAAKNQWLVQLMGQGKYIHDKRHLARRDVVALIFTMDYHDQDKVFKQIAAITEGRVIPNQPYLGRQIVPGVQVLPIIDEFTKISATQGLLLAILDHYVCALPTKANLKLVLESEKVQRRLRVETPLCAAGRAH